MNFRLKRHITLTLMTLAVLAVNAQVKVESRLDTMKILIGEQVNLRVNVTSKPDARIDFPAYESTQEMAPGIEVVETKGDTVDADNGLQVFTKIYTLTSWDKGKYNIPAQNVKVDGKAYNTNSIPLTVETVAVDTTNVAAVKPAKDVQDNPFAWSDWNPVFWFGVLLVFLIAVIYYLRIRLASGKPIMSHIRFVKRLLPHQKAMKAIEDIKAEQLVHSEDQKVYYTRLTDTLRGYLAERFGINAMEMTSSEIIDRLRAEEDKTKIEELREVFETADLVKFAKYSAQVNLNDMYLTNVVKFIDDTKQEGQPTVEKVGDDLTIKEKREAHERKVLRIAVAMLTVTAVAVLAYMGWLVYGLIG